MKVLKHRRCECIMSANHLGLSYTVFIEGDKGGPGLISLLHQNQNLDYVGSGVKESK
jgi:hypothetical protein